MSENKRYTVIHLGNPVDCVIKDHTSDNTIGIFSSMHNPVNEVCDLLNEQDQQIYCLKTESDKYKILFSRKEMDYINLRRTHVGLKDEIKELSGIRCDLIRELNKKDERIKELKTRNKRQYERLKEITDLMFKRDWKTIETMVDEWEKEEEQLQKYGG